MHFTKLMRILKQTLYKFVAIIGFIPCTSGIANNETDVKFNINARNSRKLEDINEENVLERSQLRGKMASIIGSIYRDIISIIILTMILTALATVTILFILNRFNCVSKCCHIFLCWFFHIFLIDSIDQSSSPSSGQQNISECAANT